MELLKKKLMIKEMVETYVPDWKIEYFKARFLFGQARCYTRTLRFNLVFMEQRSFDEVGDLVLHEIAHALNFEWHNRFNHGKEFKGICNQLGCSPRAKIPITLKVKAKYTMTCENGCFKVQRNKNEKRIPLQKM